MFQILLWSRWKRKKGKYRCGQRTVRLAIVVCSQKQNSLRAQAQLMRTETVETFELVKGEPKLFKRGERRTTEVRKQALPSAYHCQTYLPF
ncbi:hypothetical protein TNCV_2955921 [Trichonephila clavipes]|nr:hypothetical protein TNCV_2955921 [Trichonephila clavipes]